MVVYVTLRGLPLFTGPAGYENDHSISLLFQGPPYSGRDCFMGLPVGEYCFVVLPWK